MSTTNNSGFKAFAATAAAITRGTRVKMNSSGLISAAGAGEAGIGVADEDIAASQLGTVKLWSAPGTFHVMANAAVALGARLQTLADGKVDDTTPNSNLVALEAATADGDIIEVALTSLDAVT